ncbi:MAG: hypothetical protein WCF84_15670, partial [Anaerolineae bacterium]
AGQDYSMFHMEWVHVVERAHNYTLPAIQHSQTASWDGRVSMLGYDFDARQHSPGDSAHLVLHWQGLAVTNTAYKFFVHVVDAQGKIWTQHDSVPGEGAMPTTAWLPHEVVNDEFDLTLPADMPAGEYEIQVGFYNPADGVRLETAGASSNADYITLDQKIEVVQ